MSSEINQPIDYDNYDDFQHVNFIFSPNFILLFSGLFNNETNIKVRYAFKTFPTILKNPIWISFSSQNLCKKFRTL